ncbi:MAG: hypothetical protein JWM78_2670 [Verrucomicrobiaceae bacterium]|nr:hypothetical protein [Verrucomicrobiaceae bacterium]
MAYLLFKYLTTAALIVAISEVAKRSDKLGALLTALPLISVLTLIWLYVEKQPLDKIGDYSSNTFWYVLPTLPLFLIFPFLLERIGFWLALMASSGATMILFFLLALVMRRFNIGLM